MHFSIFKSNKRHSDSRDKRRSSRLRLEPLETRVLLDVAFLNARRDYESESSHLGVTSADFNNDGVVDLAAVTDTGFSDMANSVIVRPGRQDGNFGNAKVYNVGIRPADIVAADLNLDGRLDLAVPNSISNSVSVLLGNGDGTFQAPMNYGVGTRPEEIVVGDFNSDGRPDLAVANLDGDTVSILRGNGDGTFAAAQNVAAPNPSALVVGDFNEDGRQDLALTNVVNGAPISILLGNGDGTFLPLQSSPLGAKYAIAVVSADFNGDGNLDLAVADLGLPPTVFVAVGNGDGTFVGPITSDGGPDSHRDLAVADFNDDQIPDLVVSNWIDGMISVLPGSGNGSFQSPRSFVVGGAAGPIAIADINRDGRPDVAIGAGFQISTYLGNGQGGFLEAPKYAVGDTPSDVVVSDFNGDSRLDMATSNAASQNVSVLLGVGNGTFLPTVFYAAGTGPNSIETGDFNQDFILDLATANGSSDNVSILLGNGDGTFKPAMNFAALNGPVSITLGQFTADNLLDIVVVNASFPYRVTLLPGNGDGTFAAPIPRNAGKLASSVDSGDFNGDGLDDLAVESRDTQNRTLITILLSTGNGAFTSLSSFLLVNARDSTEVRVTELNLDGRPDLLLTNTYRDTVYVGLGNGDGTFTLVPNVFEGVLFLSGALTADSADINGDGLPDLIAAGGRSNLYVRLGKGDGTFGPGGNFGPDNSPSALAAGDFNGDGRVDVTVSNSDSDNVSIFLNRSRRRTSPIPPVDDTASPIMRADVTVSKDRSGAVEPPSEVSTAAQLVNGTFAPAYFAAWSFG